MTCGHGLVSPRTLAWQVGFGGSPNFQQSCRFEIFDYEICSFMMSLAFFYTNGFQNSFRYNIYILDTNITHWYIGLDFRVFTLARGPAFIGQNQEKSHKMLDK
jgi:hypothetical protein